MFYISYLEVNLHKLIGNNENKAKNSICFPTQSNSSFPFVNAIYQKKTQY